MRPTVNLYKLNLEQRTAQRQKIFRETSERDSALIADIIRERFSVEPAPESKILDFGCGRGLKVEQLRALGYDAYGCDLVPLWNDRQESKAAFALIANEPYRLPYPDGTFDIVFSTSVFEHARNTEECFREIHRVLKTGGYSMHLFPAKYYLPYEPHILIPLANYFWPQCPRWWIGLWLILRIAYAPRLAPNFKDMYQKYCEFCKSGIHYLPNRKFKQLSLKVFGNYGSLLDFYIAHADGRYARMARRLPFRGLSAWVSSNFRMNFIFQQKLD